MMNISISETQIRDFFRGDCLILRYSELKDIHSLDDILDLIPRLFLLYEYKDNYGHWVVIFKTINKKGQHCIEFFDSYGMKPDFQLKGFNKEIRNIYGMEYPYILKLLHDSKYPIEYNNHKLQKKSDKITTCGRWCIIRSFLDQLPIDKFANLFKKNKKISNDKLITKIHQIYSN